MLRSLLVLALLPMCLSGVERNYELKVTKEEKEHVSFIICTMGFKSLPKIWSDRSSLKRSGDRIDHLHPLRFLMTVFTDEEMKAAMSNVHGRTFVWSEFKKGLYDSLTIETRNGNMHSKYIDDFAKKVGIDTQLIIGPIQQERWDDVIEILLKHIPRSGDPKRYDM